MSPATLLSQFFSLGCGLTAPQTAVLWRCLSGQQRQKLTYRLERLRGRKPGGEASDLEALKLVQALDPTALIVAIEQAVETGLVDRSEASVIEEKLFVEMTHDGQWR